MTKIICDMCGKEIINDLAAVKVTVEILNPMYIGKELHYCSKCRKEMIEIISDNRNNK